MLNSDSSFAGTSSFLNKIDISAETPQIDVEFEVLELATN